MSPDLNLSLEEQILLTEGDLHKTVAHYRQRTGSSMAMARMVVEMHAMGESLSELEPLALLKRIRALEGR